MEEKKKYPKVSRIEVIDHTKEVDNGGGRVFLKRTENINVFSSLQDNGRTLKIFITPNK